MYVIQKTKQKTPANPLGLEYRKHQHYTFETLEVIHNPVDKGIMILSHLSRNLVEPGDFGYMVGDLADAES